MTRFSSGGSEGKDIVSAANCQTSYATHVVLGKTDNAANCQTGPAVHWVQTNTSPPIVLCLRQV